MSKLETNTIDTISGSTTLTLGGTNATTIAQDAATTVTGFKSTGIDDNATSTAVTIDSSQNVGIGSTISSIGATSPKTIIASTGEQLLLQGITNGTGQSVDLLFEQKLTNDNTRAGGKISSIATGSYTAGDGNTYDSALVFYSGTDNVNTERMRIDSSGRVLIGTSTAQRLNREKLEIYNTTGEGILTFTNDLSYAGRVHKSLQSAGGTHYIDYYLSSDNANVGAITHNNSSTSYVTSSDYRLKENVNYDFDATSRLKQLKPARFNFIADANTTVDGFLAHEVSSVVPEAITGTHNEVEVWKDGEELPDGVSVGDNKLDENGNTIPVYQGIDQAKLVPLLVKTIQELEARITELENK